MSSVRILKLLTVSAVLSLTGCVAQRDQAAVPELRPLVIKSKLASEPSLEMTLPRGTKLERNEGMDFDVFYVTLPKPAKATFLIYSGWNPAERSRRIKTGLTTSTNLVGNAVAVWKSWAADEGLKSETIVKAQEVTPSNPAPDRRSGRQGFQLHLLITASNGEEVAAFHSYCRSLRVSYPPRSGD